MSECNRKLCLLQEEIGGSKEQKKKYYALSDDLQENASLPQNNSVEHDSLMSLEKKRRKKKKSLHSSMSSKDDLQEGRCGAYDNNISGDDLQGNTLILQSTVENDLVLSSGKERREPKSLRSSLSNNNTDNGLQERRDTTMDNNDLDADVGENALLLQNDPLESDLGLSSGKKKRRKLHSSVSNTKTERDSFLDANHDLKERKCGAWDNNSAGDNLQEEILLIQSTVENELLLSSGKKKRRKLKSLHSSISTNDTDNGLQQRRDATLDADLGENALLLQNVPPESDSGLSSGNKKRRKLRSSISNIKTKRDSFLDANHGLKEGTCGAWDNNSVGNDHQENMLLLQSTVGSDSVLSCGKKKRKKLKTLHSSISYNDTDNGLQQRRDATLDADVGENALLLQNGSPESDLGLSSGKKKSRKQEGLHSSVSNINTERYSFLDANHDLKEGKCGAWDNNSVGNDHQENMLLLQSTVGSDSVLSCGKKKRKKLKTLHSSISYNDTDNGLQQRRDATLDADVGENTILLQNGSPESDSGLSSGNKKRRKLRSSISNIKTERDSFLDANHGLKEGKCGAWDNNSVGNDHQENMLLLQSTVGSDSVLSCGKKKRKKLKTLHSSISYNDTDNGLQQRRDATLDADVGENALLLQNGSPESDLGLSSGKKKSRKQEGLHSSVSNINTERYSFLDANHDLKEGKCGAWDNNSVGNDHQENMLLLQSTVGSDSVLSCGKKKRKKLKTLHSSISYNDTDNGLQQRRDATLDADVGENTILLQNGSPESDLGLSSGNKKRRKLRSSISNIKTERDSFLDANHGLKEGKCGAWDNNSVGNDHQENMLLLQSTVGSDSVLSCGKKKRKKLKTLHSSISYNDTDNGLQQRRDATLDADVGENTILLQNGSPESDLGLSSGKKKSRKQQGLHSSVSNIKTDLALRVGRDSVLDANHDLEEGKCGPWDNNTVVDDLEDKILLIQSTVENDSVLSCRKKKKRKLESLHSSISYNDADNGLQQRRDATLDADLGENALLLQNVPPESDSGLSSGNKKRRKLRSSISNIKTERDSFLDANHGLKEGTCGAWDNNSVGNGHQENMLLLQSTVGSDSVLSCGKKKRKKLKTLHSSISYNDTDNGLQQRRDATLDADVGENALLLQNGSPESDLGLSSGKKKSRKQEGLHSSVSNIKTDLALRVGRDSVLDANHDLEEGKCGPWDNNTVVDDLEDKILLIQSTDENDLLLSSGKKKRRKLKSLNSSISNNDADNGLQERRDARLDNTSLGANLDENALLQNATLESDLCFISGRKRGRNEHSLHSSVTSVSNIKTYHGLQVGNDIDLDKNVMGVAVEENAFSLENSPAENDSVLSKKRKRPQNEKDNLHQVLRLSLERPLLESSRKKLLILDLNGLLVDVVPSVSKGYLPDIRVSRKGVFKRPFCDNFLRFCFEKFDVGVWTSRTKKNMNIVLNYLFGKSKQRLVFCWDRQHCSCTPFNTLENNKKPLVLKQLKQLWECLGTSIPWKDTYYNESNTVLLDDSPYKALRNPLHTGIFPEPYSYKNAEDNSLGPGGDIRCYLEVLAMAENVQKYIEQNPFGQQAITETDPHWDFYSKVLVCKTHRC